MLVELSVVEQRYHAVMEVVCGGVPLVEVAERRGPFRSLRFNTAVKNVSWNDETSRQYG